VGFSVGGVDVAVNSATDCDGKFTKEREFCQGFVDPTSDVSVAL